MSDVKENKRKQYGFQLKEGKMRASVIFALAMLMFASVLVIGRQAMTTNPNASQDNKASEAQNQGQAQNPVGTDVKLKKRDIKLTITPVRYSDTVFKDVPVDRYRVGERVNIQMEMTNLMAEETEVVFGDHYFQNRFHLVKDGKPVLYRKGLSENLKKAEEGRPGVESRIPYLLPPNKPIVIGVIPLRYWYDTLEPGHYELTMRHRFWRKEQPVDSNTVTFDIVP